MAPFSDEYLFVEIANKVYYSYVICCKFARYVDLKAIVLHIRLYDKYVY